MAIHDYRALTTFPQIRTFAPTNTFDVIKIPSQVSRVQIGSETVACYVATDKTNGEAISPIDNYAKVPAGNLLTFHLGRGSSRNAEVQVALTAAGTQVVTIILEEM